MRESMRFAEDHRCVRSARIGEALMPSQPQNLIYDVGLHKGEDTDFYLKKGFSVIAIEASPDLVAHAKVRFKEAIINGTLRLIEGAIAPASAGAKIFFYANSTE